MGTLTAHGSFVREVKGKIMVCELLDLSGFYLQRKILGRKTPLLASVKLTYKCNLACRMCPFHLRSDGEGASMSWETARRVMDDLKSAGTRIVVFEGGEPLLWGDGARGIRDVLGYARQKFMRVAVTTNGTLPLYVPSDLLWVSLDGLKDIQDEYRGGSFDRVWDNIRRSGHPNMFVHVTMHRGNVGGMENLFSELKKIPSVRGITVQLFYRYGQGEQDLALAPGERRRGLEKVIELKKRGFPIINSVSRLRSMIGNTWRCHDDVLINADPDGEITTGCYARNRGAVDCAGCGFTPVAEASGALDLAPGPIIAGFRTFLRR